MLPSVQYIMGFLCRVSWVPWGQSLSSLPSAHLTLSLALKSCQRRALRNEMKQELMGGIRTFKAVPVRYCRWWHKHSVETQQGDKPSSREKNLLKSTKPVQFAMSHSVPLAGLQKSMLLCTQAQVCVCACVHVYSLHCLLRKQSGLVWGYIRSAGVWCELSTGEKDKERGNTKSETKKLKELKEAVTQTFDWELLWYNSNTGFDEVPQLSQFPATLWPFTLKI